MTNPFSPRLTLSVHIIRFLFTQMMFLRPPFALPLACLSFCACLLVFVMQLKLFHISLMTFSVGLDFVYGYIDDILIASSSEAEHLAHMDILFNHLSEYGIVINPSKWIFGAASLEFLGHQISVHGISPLPQKVQPIQDFPAPSSLRKLRGFLGLVNFFHRFIPHCTSLVQPLTDLL